MSNAKTKQRDHKGIWDTTSPKHSHLRGKEMNSRESQENSHGT